jgi:hypothetical protein
MADKDGDYDNDDKKWRLWWWWQTMAIMMMITIHRNGTYVHFFSCPIGLFFHCISSSIGNRYAESCDLYIISLAKRCFRITWSWVRDFFLFWRHV